MTTRHREPLSAKGFYIEHCPACGNPVDRCRAMGHAPDAERDAKAILDAHDRGDHSNCHWAADCRWVPRHGGAA